VLREVTVAEEIGIGAGGDDEEIVADGADAGEDAVGRCFYLLQFGDAYAYVFDVVEYFTQGEGDITGVEAGGGYLVKEGLKLVVIVLIYKGDIEAGVIAKFAGKA
jgi:hypothetical protein